MCSKKENNSIMNAANRLLINTSAQYIRTIINAILSLYSTRLVLYILGESDFGIYYLLGSVIAMLSFATSAMSSSTQRFLSYNQQPGNLDKLKMIFGNCILLHFFAGLALVALLASISPLLFNGFLNIPIERIGAAEKLYFIIIFILLVSLVTSPFRALLISHENIVFISIIDVVDGALKVILVLILRHIEYDKLVSYGLIMLFIQSFSLLSLSIYSYIKYEECIVPKIRSFNKSFVREISQFFGWTIYGVACLSGRAEGISIILNKAVGPVINASYGLGIQVSGYISFVAESLKNAIKPQTIKAEGDGNRVKMLYLAGLESKMAFFLMSAISIPAFFEMEILLKLWLGEVPENALLFTRMFLMVSTVDALTTGLGTANMAVGRIKNYNLVVFTTKLLTMPFTWFLLVKGFSMETVAYAYIAIELISTLFRLPVLKHEIGLSITSFAKQVFSKEIVPVSICILTTLLIVLFINSEWRFFITFPLSATIYAFAIYSWGLELEEKNVIKRILRLK